MRDNSLRMLGLPVALVLPAGYPILILPQAESLYKSGSPLLFNVFTVNGNLLPYLQKPSKSLTIVFACDIFLGGC